MEQRAIIVAHRGASYDAPENTLASVSLAWEQGADAIEVDVHMSKDNGIIVIHDYDTLRTTGSRLLIKDHSLRELKILDAGSWKDEKWKDIHLPTLSEIISTVPQSKRIFIEIKCEPEVLLHLKESLNKCSLSPEQIVIMDFNLETVIKARDVFPDFEILWLSEFLLNEESTARKEKMFEIINIAAKYGLTGVNIENINELDKSIIEKTHSNTLKCYSWTIDDPQRAKDLIDWGIDGVTTNRPGWMRDQLDLLNK